MDLWICCWNKSESLVHTQHLMPFYFVIAGAEYLVDPFMHLQNDRNKRKHPLQWDALANL